MVQTASTEFLTNSLLIATSRDSFVKQASTCDVVYFHRYSFDDYSVRVINLFF